MSTQREGFRHRLSEGKGGPSSLTPATLVGPGRAAHASVDDQRVVKPAPIGVDSRTVRRDAGPGQARGVVA